MKIVINAASTKMGGAVSYITELLRHLPAAAGDVQFTVFLPPETAAMVERSGPNIRLLPTRIGYAGTLRRLWWEQVTLRRFLKKQKAGALFSTANFAMFRCPARQLLLITNLLYSSNVYREKFLPRHSLRYRLAFALRRWLVGRSVRAADVVMTPTQAMLDDLRGHARGKTAVVNPFGVTAPAAPELPQNDTADRPRRAENGVVRLLYVSLYSEHKNLNTLLKAMAILNARPGTRFVLKTTADPAWAGAARTVTHQEDIALARQAGIAEHVEFTGILGRRATGDLYRNSDIFVFPSLAESFGFPMAEAMSHGLPIIAADTPVNREVCGQAAIYFNPLSAGDLAGRLLSLAADSALCRRLGSRGREAAAGRFCWSAHAGRILEMAFAPSPDTVRGCQSVPLAP
jgi:glycosyltransferase involved in cell wall biosynthesis